MLTIMPAQRVMAKPRMGPEPCQNRMTAVSKRGDIGVENGTEHLVIAGLDRAAETFARSCSSRIRSKMSTLASTAIPMVSTIPAIPGSVITGSPSARCRPAPPRKEDQETGRDPHTHRQQDQDQKQGKVGDNTGLAVVDVMKIRTIAAP